MTVYIGASSYAQLHKRVLNTHIYNVLLFFKVLKVKKYTHIVILMVIAKNNSEKQ